MRTHSRDTGQNTRPLFCGRGRKFSSLWKSRAKRLLVGGYCWDVIPGSVVAWAVARWDLGNE